MQNIGGVRFTAFYDEWRFAALTIRSLPHIGQIVGTATGCGAHGEMCPHEHIIVQSAKRNESVVISKLGWRSGGKKQSSSALSHKKGPDSALVESGQLAHLRMTLIAAISMRVLIAADLTRFAAFFYRRIIAASSTGSKF